MAHESSTAQESQRRQSLYESDYYTWALEQARALKEHRWEEVDWENLADEVEGLAKSEKRELQSRLKILLEHLIKWEFKSERRSRSWEATIAVQRIEIPQHLEESPGLKSSIGEILNRAYIAARANVAKRYLHKADPQPPEVCPWSFDQVMDEKFWPGSAGAPE